MACLVSHVKQQHTELLSDILAILAPQGWEKDENAGQACAAFPRLITHFEVRTSYEHRCGS